MDLSISEHSILKKVDVIYLKCENKLHIISSDQSILFKDIESIKIEKAIPSFIVKLNFWLFVLTDNTNYPNKAKRAMLDYRYAKSISIHLTEGKTIRSYHTAFDLITTSKIIKKINEEINTPFKYRV